MAWLAVNGRGDELIFGKKPNRDTVCNLWYVNTIGIYLPQGSIERLVGHNMTWDDEPIELYTVKPID